MPLQKTFHKLLLAIGVLLLVVVFLTVCAAAWSVRRADLLAATDLKLCGLELRLYASGSYYPSLSSKSGRLMCDTDGLYPQFLSDPTLLISPMDPIRNRLDSTNLTPDFCFENSSYFYLGYRVWNDETVEAFAAAYRKRLEEGLTFETALPVDLPIGQLARLRDNRQNHQVNEAEMSTPTRELSRYPDSMLPVLIECPHPYPGPVGLYILGPIPLSKPTIGGAVLYLDGHTEFIPYPGKWPMTERTMAILMELSAER